MNVQGAKVLVTGGAVRMGRTIARRLAAEGADVALHYRSSAQEAEELAVELLETGVRAITFQADLDSEEACRELVVEATAGLGGLNVLVNNASVFNKDTLRTLTAEGMLKEWWPNLMAPALLTRFFAEQTDTGKVINLLDRRITSDDTEHVSYLLSKKGLASLTRLAALEYAPGITVNGVAPGAILPPPGESADYLKEKAGPVPLDRQCTDEEIADAVLFLLENDALTGQVIYVDGGQHLL